MAKCKTHNLWLLAIAVILLSGCALSEVDPASDEMIDPDPTEGSVEIQQGRAQIDSIVRDKDGMTQFILPGGTFIMGSSEEEVDFGIDLCLQHYSPCNRWYYEREFPPREVTVSPFNMDQWEVTNQQYSLCVEDGICAEPLECKKGDPTYLDPEKTDHPAVCVSWNDANDYCEWAGGRLPTEAEWEYAFRGVESFIFPWGNEFIGSNLNYCDVNCDQGHADDVFDDGYKRTAPGGEYPSGRSWAGLDNLGGNVSEWVGDWYGENESGTLINPAGPDSGTEKLIKGCSWYSPAAYCRGATRGSVDPNIRFDYLGFRCAGNPAPIIDGVHQPGEWDQAEEYSFEDGSKLFLLYSDNHLYLAIKAVSDELISANVFLASEERIDILHTSAALGTASYETDGETWRKVRDFEWCCRSTMDTAGARAAREAIYHTDNWLGINSFNGNENELEYKINLTGAEEKLAVNFLRANNIDDRQIWPVGISDGPTHPAIGGFPETLDFTLENWHVLEMDQ